jgi:hypothetical protein
MGRSSRPSQVRTNPCSSSSYNCPAHPCISRVSAAAAGNAKDVVQTILGAILFHDFTPTFQNITGILVSFTGTGTSAALGLQSTLYDR